MTLIEKYKQLKLGVKYGIKNKLIIMAINKYSNEEALNLIDCAEAAVSYWENKLSKYIENDEYRHTEIEQEIQLDNFGYYLMINVLYDLIVKNKVIVSICRNYYSTDVLVECAMDSGLLFIPFTLDTMSIYKDKVMLNSVLYYDSALSNEENKSNQEVANSYAKTKSYDALLGLMINRRH